MTFPSRPTMLFARSLLVVLLSTAQAAEPAPTEQPAATVPEAVSVAAAPSPPSPPSEPTCQKKVSKQVMSGGQMKTAYVDNPKCIAAWKEYWVAAAGNAWVGAMGYRMRVVPPGTYEVGCTAGQANCESDETRHSVKLTHPYLIGETEVTQGLWLSVMRYNPSKFSWCGRTCPVETVSWVDAATFANKLSAIDGLQACYSISGSNVSWTGGWSCSGYRLPTEAEWEVAARGGRDALYSGGTELSAVGWYNGNSGGSTGSTHPVGKLQANGYGLYDMSGNVWEWVWDWYGGYSSGLQVDPQGAASGSSRVIRGGSWYYSPAYARVALRGGNDPGLHSNYLGFRLARTIP